MNESSSDPPPRYPTKLPAAFHAGAVSTPPLVNVPELQAHLRLLGAFHKLKANVESKREGIVAKDKNLAWVVFVNKAVVSFFNWTSSDWGATNMSLDQSSMPPLPAIMVWHTYLLNPLHYYEDSQRIPSDYSKNLCLLEEFPLELAASLIDEESMEPHPPTLQRHRTFEERASSPYDIQLITHADEGLPLPCPFCEHINPLVLWVADGERGFAQRKFEHKCESCGETFNKRNIGIGRFVDEFIMKKETNSVYFSETYLDPRTGTKNPKSADSIYSKLFKQLDAQWISMQSSAAPKKEQKRLLATTLQWNPDVLCEMMHMSAQPQMLYDSSARAKLLVRLSTAYSHSGYASLDLVAAVLRQGSFIEKMVHMGWTRPGRWELTENQAPLVRSIARYHAYLHLMYVTRSALLVPTLDIDLAWHTHQLKGRSYRADTLRNIARILNHDDSIDAGVISSRYDHTAKLWMDHYGVPYSVCGCAPDTVEPTGNRRSRWYVPPHPAHPAPKPRSTIFSKIAAQFRDKPKPEIELNPESTTTAVGYELPWRSRRADLTSTENEDSETSHPSEHNIVFGTPESFEPDARQTLRQRKVAKYVKHAEVHGKEDPFRVLQLERNRKNKELDRHPEAFTDITHGSAKYYAFWGVSMAIPLGFYGGFAPDVPGACGTGCASCGTDSGGGGGDGGGGCSGGCGGCCGGGGGGCGVSRARGALAVTDASAVRGVRGCCELEP